MTPRSLAAAVLLSATAALAGCTTPAARAGNANPAPLVSPSPATLVSPSPRPSSAKLPVDLREATITVPAFPGAKEYCPTARRHFVHGVVDIGGTADIAIRQHPLDQTVLTDLDGKPGDETVIALSCNTSGSVHPVQLLVLTIGDKGRSIKPVGYAVSPNLQLDLHTFHVSGTTLVIDTIGAYQSDGWPTGPRQTRAYAFHEGAFRQVSGPASFPAPPTDIHAADLANGTVALNVECGDGGGLLAYVAFRNGVAENAMIEDCSGAGHYYRLTLEPIGFAATSQGEVAVVRVTRADEHHSDTVVYAVNVQDGTVPFGWTIAATGKDDVTGIGAVSVSEDGVTVAITRNGKTENRAYHRNENGQTWQ